MTKVIILTLSVFLLQITNIYAAQIRLDFNGVDAINNINFYGSFLYETDPTLAVETRSIIYNPTSSSPESNLLYTFASSPYFGTATFESTASEFDPMTFDFNGASVLIADNFPSSNPFPGFDLQTVFSTSPDALFDQENNLLSGEAIYIRMDFNNIKFDGTGTITSNDIDLTQSIIFLQNDTVGQYSATPSTISFTVVPIPAGVWLFGTALFGLLGFSRREKFLPILRNRFENNCDRGNI